MEHSTDDVSDKQIDIPVPLQRLGADHLKLSGTSFIFRDYEKKYIYKVIKHHSATEALFYSMAYRIKFPDGENLTVNNINSNTFVNLAYLVEKEIIPYFYGLTTISHNDSSWYELPKNSTSLDTAYRAIKLENLLRDLNNPGIIDIKLGSHNFNYNSDYGDIDSDLKLKCIDSYREKKLKSKELVPINQPFHYKLDLNASDLGLPDSYNSLDTNTLHSVLKTWRQEQVSLQTPEQELGFRISSICFEFPDRKFLLTSNEAKHLDKSQTINILQRIFNDIHAEVFKLNLIEFLNRLKTWINQQTSISIVASSILIIFDQNDLQRYKFKWIDFTHINHKPVKEDSSNMVKGIDNLINIIAK